MNRMSRCAALIGTLLSLSGFACGAFAQECEEISLFRNGSDAGKMMEGSTFPEMPEWAANWGNLDGMTPPYIRFSGQKNSAGNWSGEMSFPKLPATVTGGSLKLKLRSTQKGRAALWLKLSSGKSSTYQMDVAANKTYSVEVPLTAFGMGGAASVAGVGVGLVNVPAYQYTTLFVDDVAFTCGAKLPAASNVDTYPYSDINPSSAVREGKFLESSVSPMSGAYDADQRKSLRDSTTFDFVVSAMEQAQIDRYANANDLTPKQSRDGWYRSLYLVERNRLKDNVIANPKALFYDGEAYAAGSDYHSAPLLIGNVDYGYKICMDTSCVSQKIVSSRLLLAGLPLSYVKGSVLQLYYDPYYVTTNRKNLPEVEIEVDEKRMKLSPKSSLKLKLPGAGIQKVKVRLTEGGITTTQTLFVEVK